MTSAQVERLLLPVSGVTYDDVSSGQVDQLFDHLSQQLVQVRSSVSDALQTRYDYFTSSAGQLNADAVNDICRQLTSLNTIIDYTEKARRHQFMSSAPSSNVFSFQIA